MDSLFFDNFISNFHIVRKYGSKVQCKCPAHDDKEASLSISIGTKNTNCIVLKCHAGCDTDSVLGAVGLSMSDTFYKDDSVRDTDSWKRYVEGREGR